MLSVIKTSTFLFGALSSIAVGAAPTAKVKNGTYVGVHSAEYNEDFFLGIPFAQPPVGDLRYRVPQPLNTTWKGKRSATEYSTECYGYGSDQWNYPVSEDCLYLNVVRPSGYENQKLPIGFWIHGGGLTEGGGVDQRYNLSFIVQNSVKIGKPIIGVSINYRLSSWGFLGGKEIQQSGQTNLGLRDQRIALAWVQENIAGFGGDPKKVAIWGESAGGASVGMHLTAYGGRDDHLFRAGILESGAPVYYTALYPTAQSQDSYNTLVQKTGCNNADDTLACLRGVPEKKLNNVINSTAALVRGTFSIDGDIIQGRTSKQVKTGRFVHVPVLAGTTADEGTAFGPQGVTNTSVFYQTVVSGRGFYDATTPAFARKILKAYPDIPALGIPSTDELPPHFRPGPPYGKQYRRSSAYWGDVAMFANRRLTCEMWAAEGVPAYCFRFNAKPAGNPQEIGVTHFSEVAFVFNNIKGVGYEPAAIPPFTGKGKAYRDLSNLMTSDWASFISDLDPNAWRKDVYGGDGPEAFPVYSLDEPQDYVYDANVSSFAEPDTYRKRGMKLINDNAASKYQR